MSEHISFMRIAASQQLVILKNELKERKRQSKRVNSVEQQSKTAPKIYSIREESLKIHGETMKVRRIFVTASDSGEYTKVGWVLSCDVDRCMVCHIIFGSFSSKHHCRACGNVVCCSCCNTKAEIVQLASLGPVKVCTQCFWGQTEVSATINDADGVVLAFVEEAQGSGKQSDDSVMDLRQYGKIILSEVDSVFAFKTRRRDRSVVYVNICACEAVPCNAENDLISVRRHNPVSSLSRPDTHGSNRGTSGAPPRPGLTRMCASTFHAAEEKTLIMHAIYMVGAPRRDVDRHFIQSPGRGSAHRRAPDSIYDIAVNPLVISEAKKDLSGEKKSMICEQALEFLSARCGEDEFTHFQYVHGNDDDDVGKEEKAEVASSWWQDAAGTATSVNWKVVYITEGSVQSRGGGGGGGIGSRAPSITGSRPPSPTDNSSRQSSLSLSGVGVGTEEAATAEGGESGQTSNKYQFPTFFASKEARHAPMTAPAEEPVLSVWMAVPAAAAFKKYLQIPCSPGDATDCTSLPEKRLLPAPDENGDIGLKTRPSIITDVVKDNKTERRPSLAVETKKEGRNGESNSRGLLSSAKSALADDDEEEADEILISNRSGGKEKSELAEQRLSQAEDDITVGSKESRHQSQIELPHSNDEPAGATETSSSPAADSKGMPSPCGIEASLTIDVPDWETTPVSTPHAKTKSITFTGLPGFVIKTRRCEDHINTQVVKSTRGGGGGGTHHGFLSSPAIERARQAAVMRVKVFINVLHNGQMEDPMHVGSTSLEQREKPLVAVAQKIQQTTDAKGELSLLYTVAVGSEYFKPNQPKKSINITSRCVIQKIINAVNKKHVDCLSDECFSLPHVRNNYKGDPIGLMTYTVMTDAPSRCPTPTTEAALLHANRKGSSSSRCPTPTESFIDTRQTSSSSSRCPTPSDSLERDNNKQQRRSFFSDALTDLLRPTSSSIKSNTSTPAVEGEEDNGCDSGCSEKSNRAARELTNDEESAHENSDEVATADGTLVRPVARRATILSGIFSPPVSEPAVRNVGRELITSEDMLEYVANLSLEEAGAKLLKQASAKDASVLLGWQVIFPSDESDEAVDNIQSLDICIVTGMRKSALRKTEYRISGKHVDDYWVLLKRSGSKAGAVFWPLRKVLFTEELAAAGDAVRQCSADGGSDKQQQFNKKRHSMF